MALDLKGERLVSFPGPVSARPVRKPAEASWKLTNVNARLGVAFRCYEPEAVRMMP